MVDHILLQIAKMAIVEHFDETMHLNKEALLKQYPFLNEQGAVFVTLNYDNTLRGCIGSIIAHRSLLEDVIHNAKAAAFHDPRFNGLDQKEFDHLDLEVSVLTPPKVLIYKDYDDLMHQVRPFKDGLILQYGAYQGTFLPQVWEHLPTPTLFLEHLSQKAGLTPLVYQNHPNIYRYEVHALEELFNAILPLE
jgi:AmmeMemoRadiSam system protein A